MSGKEDIQDYLNSPKDLPVDFFTVADATNFQDVIDYDLGGDEAGEIEFRDTEDKPDRAELPEKTFPDREDIPAGPNTIGLTPVLAPGPSFAPVSTERQAINLFEADPDLEIFVDISDSLVDKKPEVPDNAPITPVNLVPPGRQQTIGIVTGDS